MDLGMSTGTQLDTNELVIKSGWGVKYQPNQKELKLKIKELETQLKYYRSQIQ